MSETLILNGKGLTLEDLYSVVYDRRPVQIDPEVIPLVDKSRQVLFDMAADGKPVYGLNHGVGWNKDREFSQDFFEQYNRNLINSHSLGVAPFASVEEVRAMMCIRLNTALCGRTGIASNILKMYEEFLNHGIHPRAMRRGAVGEGDVSTMSMIGQAMIGQGEVEYHGEIIPAIDAMRAEGIEPAILGPKDGLSIVSSNAQGESMVVLLVKEVEELIKLSDAIYCLHLEGLNGGLQPLGERVNEVRGLPGQIHCAAECRRFLEGSYLEHPDSKRALQDPLSFRCGAAINGSVYDSLEYVKKILELQINRTDDNPCILYEEGTTSVSPNFEVTTLSLGVDMLAAALCHMSHAITNRLYKIVDPRLHGSQPLPDAARGQDHRVLHDTEDLRRARCREPLARQHDDARHHFLRQRHRGSRQQPAARRHALSSHRRQPALHARHGAHARGPGRRNAPRPASRQSAQARQGHRPPQGRLPQDHPLL